MSKGVERSSKGAQAWGSELFSMTGLDSCEKSLVLRLELNTIAWMKDILTRFVNTDQVFMDHCAETLATASSIMMMSILLPFNKYIINQH